MTETQFITQNEARWKELEAFNQTLTRKGTRALSRIEVRAFAECFRAAGYHLAYAKTHFPDSSSVPYLSHIVGVAHNYYYVRSTAAPALVKEYFLHGFPAACRAAWFYAVLAAALFMLGAVFAYSYVASDTARFAQIFPFEFTGDSLRDDGTVEWDYPLMSAIIMTNNIRVAIMALAFGITAGIGTVWILFYNGMILGALAAYVASTGSHGDMLIFWSLILPHGVPELAAIFLSGACGLIIGRAVIMPGSLSRRDAVVRRTREATMLMPGIAVMLVLAALVEGFFTPLGVPPVVKLGFAGVTLVGLGVYFVRR